MPLTRCAAVIIAAALAHGRGGFVAPCGDVKAAAEALDLVLKERMFPGRRWA
ncbi:hypothetical protein [Actinomadura bangladeshensis]|uniref:Uncharacterized protein n=1 Tax=Actinomadura bangladeshensis TaxID=453573 RepID=A0A6L9QNM3_9ACTN|nr:hypothetical protein [Actinomadura bangladeshensis]NEA26666.1 hypothetical protein [Actinomadura bangladeshensis]